MTARTKTEAACLAAAMAARRPFIPDKPLESDPTYTLDRQIAQARREMGESKWQKLNEEWET